MKKISYKTLIFDLDDTLTDDFENTKQAFSLLCLENSNENLTFTYQMSETDVVYGLGEQVRGMNKRGFTYISNATDDPLHTEDKHSLYAGHNFFVMCGKKTFGMFIDTPGKVVFDVGETEYDVLKITAEKDCIVYTIEGESLKDIVKQFRQLIGTSYIPPKWAFGYQQCKWSYMNEDEIRDVVRNHRENNIPLDAVYLDIDYMDHYKDFTINEKTFPEFPAFFLHLHPVSASGP